MRTQQIFAWIVVSVWHVQFLVVSLICVFAVFVLCRWIDHLDVSHGLRGCKPGGRGFENHRGPLRSAKRTRRSPQRSDSL